MHRHERDKRFLQALAALSEAVSQDISDAKLKIYAKALEDMPVEDIERACWQIIRTRTTATFPKVAEIREAVYGKSDDHAQLALNKIEAGIERYGNGHADTVVFDDPYIHATIHQLGGWIKVSAIFWESEWPFYRKDVLRTYSALCRTPLSQLDVPAQLVGWHDLNNQGNGIKHTSKVKLIGDAEQIQAWQDQLCGKSEQQKIQHERVNKLVSIAGGKV